VIFESGSSTFCSSVPVEKGDPVGEGSNDVHVSAATSEDSQMDSMMENAKRMADDLKRELAGEKEGLGEKTKWMDKSKWTPPKEVGIILNDAHWLIA